MRKMTLGVILSIMKINIKLLNPEARVPAYQTSGASGFDLECLEDIIISPRSIVLVETGLAVEIPKNYELQIRTRSSMALNGVMVLNTPGTVDSDYRGELKVILHNVTAYPRFYQKGSRIAQAVVCPIVQVSFQELQELSETIRGAAGHGSTGV
jgi:dUTP pyrophosphatase